MRFRKKPVVIEAIQWTGGNFDAVYAFGGGDISSPEGIQRAKITCHDDRNAAAEPLYVDTLEGTTRASVGDWIIRGIKGEFCPCKPDIFEATYEAVE